MTPALSAMPPGTLVRCVNAQQSGSSSTLVLGDTYTVSEAEGPYVRLPGFGAWWFHMDRFVLAPPAPALPAMTDELPPLRARNVWAVGYPRGGMGFTLHREMKDAMVATREAAGVQFWHEARAAGWDVKPVTVIDRNPRTGTDCNTSSAGMSSRSAF